MSVEEDEEVIRFHDDRYYQTMLRSLQNDDITKPITHDRTIDDDRSPFKYIRSVKAMKVLEGKVGVETMIDHTHELKDDKRVQFLCERDALNMRFSSTAGMMKELSLLRAATPHTKLEQQVERQLLQPYRKNGPNRGRLFAHVNRLIRAKEELNKPPPLFINEPAHGMMMIPPPITISTPTAALTTEERLNSARSRRQMLEQQETQRHQHTVEETEQRAHAALEAQHALHQIESDRVKSWLTIFCAATIMQHIRHNIEETRRFRSVDQRRWAAALCIQRKWLSWHGIGTDHAHGNSMADVINRFKQSPQFAVEQRQFQRRQQAANLLLQFLRGSRRRGQARKIIRTVHLLQSRFRGLRRINRDRVLLLSHLMELCLMPLATHVSVVASHRGLDLKNLGAFENQQLKQHPALSRAHRVIASMHSVGFHKLLRRQLPRIQDIHRDLIANTKLWTEKSEFRKQLLAELLRDKRQLFLQEIQYVEPLSAVLPPFDLKEVAAFLRGGPDPVAVRLEDLAKRQQKWNDDLRQPMRPFKGDNPPRFLLMHYIKPSDVLKFFCDFLEGCTAQAAAATAAAAQSKHGLGMMRPAPIRINKDTEYSNNSGGSGHNEQWENDSTLRLASPSKKTPSSNRNSTLQTSRRSTIRKGNRSTTSRLQHQSSTNSGMNRSIGGSSDASDISSVAPPRSVRRSTVMNHKQRRVVPHRPDSSNGSSIM